MKSLPAGKVAHPQMVLPPRHASSKTVSPQGTGLTKWREARDDRRAAELPWEEPSLNAQGGYAATTLTEAFGEDEIKNISSITAYTKTGKPLFGRYAKSAIPAIDVEKWTPPGQKQEYAKIARRLVTRHQNGSVRVIDGYIFTNIPFPPKNRSLFDQQIKIVLWFEQEQDRALNERQPAQGRRGPRSINQEIFRLAVAKPVFTFSAEEVKGEKIKELASDHEVTLLKGTGKRSSSQERVAIALRFLGDKTLLEKIGGAENLEKMRLKINDKLPDSSEKVKKAVQKKFATRSQGKGPQIAGTSQGVFASRGRSSDVHAEEVAGAQDEEDVEVPLVGELRQPVGDIYAEDDDKEASRLLGAHFTACRIKGDGHCLFRAIAVALLDKYSQAPKRLTAIVTKGKSAMAKGSYALSQTDIRNIAQTIRLLRQGKSAQEIMLRKTLSHSWVKFLRHLSAAAILSRSPEELKDAVPQMVQELNDKALTERFHRLSTQRRKEKELEDINKEIVARYLVAKTNMSEQVSDRSYGTELEIVSLSRALGLNITLLDFHACVENRQFAYNTFPDGTFSSSDNPPPVGDIFLCHKDIHYNTLFSKIEPVEED